MARSRSLLALAALFALACSDPAAAKGPVFVKDGLAIGGYDPVAYFSEGRPVPGDAAHELHWRGATWRFASAGNRARFEAEPERWAPQYGGFCAYGVAQGYTVKTEPDAWKVVEGKLYLNYDRAVQKRWEQDIPGYVEQADRNWPGLRGEG